MRKTTLLLGLILVGAALVLAACGGQTGTPTAEGPAATEAPAMPTLAVPFEAGFLASGHADAKAEAFVHWDEEGTMPGACARCHASAGYVDYLTNGQAADVAAPAGPFTCETCHNDKAMALTSVTFPSGKVVETSEEGEARCMTCHQGRESKVSVDKQITDFKVTDVDAVVAPIKDASGADVTFGFRNVHYFAAGATLYGIAGPGRLRVRRQDVRSQVPPRGRRRHLRRLPRPAHAARSASRSARNATTDVNDGRGPEERPHERLAGGLQRQRRRQGRHRRRARRACRTSCTAAIQAYAKDVAGTGIVYDAATYPYFFVDADGDGKADEG